jgi:hypothetical protein
MTTNQIEAEDYALTIFGLAGQVALSGVMWKYFGFDSIPNRILFFRRFANKNLLFREDLLRRELFLTIIAEYAAALRDVMSVHTAVDITARVLEIAIDSFENSQPLWPTLGFDSRNVCIEYFATGLSEYLKCESRIDRGRRLIVRILHADSSSDRKALWVLGCAQYYADDTPLAKIEPYVKNVLAKSTVVGLTALNDRFYLDVVGNAFSD